MKKYLAVCLLTIIAIFGCNKEKLLDGKNSIYEDFETVNNIDELLQNGNWEYYQQTEPSSYIGINNSNPHSGNNCLKIFATKGTVSKSDIVNNKMAFWENDIVQISAWFYIEDTNMINYLFLFDIEEIVSVGANPGIRVAIDDEGFLLIERNKYGETTLHQTEATRTQFPRNQWVELSMEIKLQQKEKGYIRLWQDGVLLINVENTQTLPTDKLYFIQGTKGMYQSVQIGVTATTSDSDVIMYIDDIEIMKIN
ncbi:MAG: heparin lyase I family protein [Bacteroidales bacterium]